MNGIVNEKRLLDSTYIPSQLETSLSWVHVQSDASRGTPVIISTPNHYWVVDDYDPVSGQYHVGQSGLAFRGGAEWMTAECIQQLGGGLNGGLYISHPTAQTTRHQVTLRVDAGWKMATAPPPRHVAGAALDPGWRMSVTPAAAPPAADAARAASPPQVADPTPVTVGSAQDRWWEDSRVVPADPPPKSAPEWV